jgi:radical SAM protein with 4Fe4S-binding SPASM domain
MLDQIDKEEHRGFAQYSGSPGTPQKLFHPRLGDLSAHNAFIMNGRDKAKFKYTETTPLYIHLSVTGRCNANCNGCINTAFNTAAIGNHERKNVPFKDTDPERDARGIANLIKKNPGETVTVCLYGGEPLLALDKLQTLIQTINKNKLPNPIRYMLYTNGDLLEKASISHPEMMRSIWLYSVSIDGTREQHERIRNGTNLRRIHEGLTAIKKIRQGQVLMWSTLREDQSLLDCFHEFTYLFDRGLVSQFFWHWVESGEPFQNLTAYADSYVNDLHYILDIYVEKLKKGILLPITHINDLVLYLLSGKKRTSTACGVELARNYDIVDGRIHSCADMPAQYAIGTIDADGSPHLTPQDFSWLTNYKNDLGCRKCGVHSYCGGRCPVQAFTGSIERLLQYCQLMRLHVSTVHDYLDEIVTALKKHRLTPQYIYNHSAYYVQFTDGTP